MRRAFRPSRRVRQIGASAAIVALGLSLMPTAGPLAPRPVSAASPSSVTIAGSLQSEIGCAGDWDPGCAATHLTYDAGDDVWQGTWSVPAGSYEYKAALDDAWTENYGLHAGANGANIPLSLASNASVKFYYDHKTHWVTDDHSSVIATAPGSYQAALGCPGDWQPDCLRSWLQDADGDGTYAFSTTVLPVGNYETKVAINESWTENYGLGGAANGANIPFSVSKAGSTVTFSYVSSSHVLTVQVTPPGFGPDDDVAWDGLRHDSRDPLYRTPSGAVPAGTPVRIRFRTFHDDVTGVTLRAYDLNAGGQRLVAMHPAATDVSCYQPDLAAYTCDFWEAVLTEPDPNNLWYRFLVTDGTDTDYYADDTTALDGGLGAVTDDPVDQSYALMWYEPGFTAPAWAKDAVIYQIFPDRFRDGRNDNDLKTGSTRYDDPVLALAWGTKPEGYCRNYTDGATNCPWRFDPSPPADSPTKEQPRGRDYFGGDLKGVDQNLDYLKSIGVNTLYFNPIFDAGSNHGYDTQDYFKVDPAFGTQKDFDNLVKHAKQLGIRILLDGVFNHMSSDSPLFDRYEHFSTVGACESVSSPYRAWFTFHDVAAGTGTCAGSAGAKSATYDGWFGFDSIPVLTKSLAAVQQYFLTSPDSVSKHWLTAGAAGWRLDVMGDASFPDGYWESFRNVVKAKKPDALIVGELWQKDSTLLRFLRGDRADTTMDYRLRDAVIGLLTPGPFDSKGFGDSGRILKPSEFAARIQSIREDYPDAAYRSLMNLLDSHDTERLLWTLTPGSETAADKESDASNVADGKRRAALAALIQFTLPGAPTIYYGDEVGVTGDDDPDDRRTYPWADLGGSPDSSIRDRYTALAALRRDVAPLRGGDLTVLLADDASGVVAYGLKTGSQAAVVIINRSAQTQSGDIPVAGWLADGTTLQRRFAVGAPATGTSTVTGGVISGSLPARSGLVLATGSIDLAPPAAPVNLHVTDEGAGQVSLAWTASAGAVHYDVYRSPLRGGGYVKANSAPVTGTSFTDTDLENGVTSYYVVRATDAAGNASAPSNEVAALPHLAIGWANLQWPPTLAHTISAVNRTDNVYGQVWIDGVTNQPGATPSLRAQAGYGPVGSDPASSSAWHWIDASFNTDAGNNDEFVASFLPDQTGTFDYAYRYTTTGGRDWVVADLDGIGNGYSPAQAGTMTVNASSDTTAPTVPTGLSVTSASPAGITLDWDASSDASLYGYEVRRSDTAGGPYGTIALVTATGYTDAAVTEGATFYYVVRAVDTSFNRSGPSDEISATAEARTVTLDVAVTVPSTTDGTGRSVVIAGTLDRLDGALPAWDPGAVVLTRADATHWTITLTGKEGTQIEYKYTLGDWDHVEKDGSCGEIANRQLTLNYGANGTQTVNDTVANWRNVAPCGN